MSTLGNKIVVVGVSAVGKTTFARDLANRLSLPLVLMDSLMWKPGWEYVGDEETVRLLDAESFKPQWVIEGYITKGARTFVFERADTIVYLDYPRWVAALRYLKRWWSHRREPRPELAGSPERFSFKFLKLVWTKGEAISLRQYLRAVEPQSKIITLKSPKEASQFLDVFKVA